MMLCEECGLDIDAEGCNCCDYCCNKGYYFIDGVREECFCVTEFEPIAQAEGSSL